MSMKTSSRGLVAAAVLALALPAAAQAAKPKQQYYVSLGDSYSVGVQAYSEVERAPTHEGYADQVVTLAKKKHYKLKLVNFGCGGATSASILEQKGCRADSRALGGPTYAGRTQVAAAERFLRKHRGRVALVTVAIGGNDVTACAREADPVTCTANAKGVIGKNVTTLVKRLRKAGGKKVRIVGTTYPDVILGQWVRPPVNQNLAQLSVVAFKSVINPTLLVAYKSANGKFVDATAATGAYGPLDQTTDLPPYGTIPVPVAKICELTYYCQYGDIHARPGGYKVIAKLIVGTLPKLKRH
jgi:lysophospholipase L1-like esterase